MQRVDVKEFLQTDVGTPVIDVRSPAEFEEGHIVGAINIPLFTNEERAQVGTTYTKIGRDKAIDLGLEIVGPKMSLLARSAKAIEIDSKVKTYCWRGGMRSEHMAWLFELVGLEVKVLEGGYKAYRQQLLHDFKDLACLIVLQGTTGSGKTMILHELRKQGEQILDLEERANHKGSAFGALGMSDQPTTAQFQNILYDDLLHLDHSKRIWIESESLSIGKVYLPETLWESMNNSNIIEFVLNKEIRARRIVEEYGHFDIDLLAASIEKIKTRFGGDRTQKSLELLKENKLFEVTMLLLDYYDKAYTFSKNKYKKKEIAILESNTADPVQNAAELINLADKLHF